MARTQLYAKAMASAARRTVKPIPGGLSDEDNLRQVAEALRRMLAEGRPPDKP